jgi:hypothetical protein
MKALYPKKTGTMIKTQFELRQKRQNPQSSSLNKLILIFILFLGIYENASYAQTTYTWANPAAGGAWTTSTNWSPSTGTPITGDNVIINPTTAITISAVPAISINQFTVTTAATGRNVTLTATSAGTTFSIGNSSVGNGTMTTAGGANGSNIIAGTNLIFSFANNSNYVHNINGGIIPTATWQAGSTCQITGITNTFPISPSFGQTFGNILWNCPSYTTINAVGNIVTANLPAQVNGTFEIRNTGGTNILDLSNLGTRTWAGNILVSGGRIALLRSTIASMNLTVNNFTVNDGGGVGTNSSVFFNNSSAGSSIANLTVNGDFTVNPTNNVASILRFSGVSSNTFNLNVKKNFSWSNGTASSAGGTNNITFNGTTSQTYSTFNNLAITSNVIIAANAIVDLGTNIFGNTGTFLLNSAATLITGNTNSTGALLTSTAFGSVQSTSTRTFSTGANYQYNGAAAQFTGNGLNQNTPANLTISNSFGVTLTGSTAMSGILNLAGGNLTLGTSNLTLGGAATVLGTFSNTAMVALNGSLSGGQ